MLAITYPLNQVSGFRTHEGRNCHVCLRNTPLCHDWRIFKRCLSDEEFIHQDTQTPEIDLLAVEALLVGLDKHLRGQIVQGTTHGLPPVVRRVNTPSEITDLDFAMDTDKDVFGLDITVHDMLLVEIFERGCHLSNVVRSLPFREPVFLSKVLVQFTPASEFQDQKDSLAVVEVAVKSQDVRMTEVALNFDFTSDLFLHAALLQLRFVQDLERAYETRRALLCQVNPAELSLSQGLSNLKHSEMELLRGCLVKRHSQRLLVFALLSIALGSRRPGIDRIDPVIIGVLQSKFQKLGSIRVAAWLCASSKA